MPRISIVIPTYNRRKELPRAVTSAHQQSFNDFEVIVVDDGSTDGTANDYANQGPQLKYIRLEKNNGVSHARNVGISLAKGEWICFLDSDDEWLPNKLIEQIHLIESHPQTKVVHCDEIWIRNGRRVNPCLKHKKPKGRVFKNCLALCCMSPSAMMIHKSVFEEVGFFREDFPVCEDYDLWLKIACRYEVEFCETPLVVKYGGHEDQLSRKYFAMDYWRIKSLHSLRSSPYLSEDEVSLLHETLVQKCEILLKGYLKHNNLENYSEIYEIYLLAQKFFDRKPTFSPVPLHLNLVQLAEERHCQKSSASKEKLSSPATPE